MAHELNHHELQACRAFHKLLAVRTEGWAEAEAADAKFDGGEWSGPAWGDHWQQAEEYCEEVIARRFGFPSAEYVMQMVNVYENEEQGRYFWSQFVTVEVWGSMGEGTEQLIDTVPTRRAAAILIEKLNNDPRNHPDLFYWFDVIDERPLPTDAWGEDMRNIA